MMWWAVENTLVAGALAGIALVACRMLKSRPVVCHLLWLLVLVKLLTPPLTLGVWPPQSWRGEVAATVAQLAPVARTDAPMRDASRSAVNPQAPPMTDPAVLERKLAQAPEKVELNTLGSEIALAREEIARAESEPKLKDQEAAWKGWPESSPIDSSGVASASSPTPGLIDASPAKDDETAAASALNWRAILPGAFVAIWLIGMIVFAAMHVRRILRLNRLVRQAADAPPHLLERVRVAADALGLRPPRVRVIDGVGGPLVWALGRPVLLWPAELLESPRELGLRGVLAHELAHLKRRDHWVAWIELAAVCVWWWNPLVWLVRRELRRHAELSCDAWVVSIHPEHRRAYAESLIEVSAQIAHATFGAPALAVATSDRRAFERRLSMIMRERASCRVSPVTALAAVALALVLIPSWSIGRMVANETSSSMTALGDVDKAVEKAVEREVLARKGRTAIEDGNWEKVTKIFTRLAELDPEDGEAQHWIGYSLIAMGETQKAREAFMHQARLRHEIGKAAYNIACTYSREGSVDDAFKYLDRAFQAGFTRDDLLESDTDLDALRDDDRFDAMLERVSQAKLLHEEAEGYFNAQDWSNAVAAYEALAKRHPHVPSIQYRLGWCTFSMGDYEAALAAFKRQMELGDEAPNAPYNVACSYAKLGEAEKAIEYLREANHHGFWDLEHLQSDPDLESLRDHEGFKTFVAEMKKKIEYMDAAEAAFDGREWQEAAERYATMLEHKPDWGEALHRLGFSLHQLGEYEGAIAAWIREAELGDGLSRSLYNIACAYALMGDRYASLAHLERAVEVGFEDGELMTTDGDLASLRDDDRFHECVRRASDVAVLRSFGVRSWKEANEEFSARVESEPGNGRAWLALGFAKLRLGDHDAAIKAFQKQKETGFAEGVALYNIACVHATKRDLDEAFVWLGRAVEQGFDVAFARTDPDLAPLRGDPRFAELVGSPDDDDGDAASAGSFGNDSKEGTRDEKDAKHEKHKESGKDDAHKKDTKHKDGHKDGHKEKKDHGDG